MHDYNYAVIRELVEEAFGDDLQSFCFDHFNKVKEQFTTGQNKSERVILLVDHAKRYGLIDKLLGEIQKENPYQFKRFESRLKEDESTSKKSQPERKEPAEFVSDTDISPQRQEKVPEIQADSTYQDDIKNQEESKKDESEDSQKTKQKWIAGGLFAIFVLVLMLMTVKLFPISPSEIQVSNINVLVIAAFLLSAMYLIRFYIINSKQFEADYHLTHGEYDWLIWPAIGLNKIFTFLFGKIRGNGFKDLITWRSASVTFLFSALANLACVYLIVTK
ncbi:MAG: hypothetical protein GY795_45445 [Desulfobacterales bacterium]|nr:hypothetical protein [Desulfobacterales bacterium]